MSSNPPRYAYSFLDDVIEQGVKPPYEGDGRVYGIDQLTNGMNWGLSQIDEELRKGNLVQVNKGGRTGFRFTCELGQSSIKPKSANKYSIPVRSYNKSKVQ